MSHVSGANYCLRLIASLLYLYNVKVNFHSYVKMAVKALPGLEKTNGSIIVVSSLLGK